MPILDKANINGTVYDIRDSYTYTSAQTDVLLSNKADNSDVADINVKIPSEASSTNKLADKDFVNSSVATATATHRGTFNLVTDLNLNISATQQQIANAIATTVSTADNNDYVFVQIPTSDSTPTEIARIDRYKYNGTAWSFEYSLNNSGFTASQWAAINSGITATTWQDAYGEIDAAKGSYNSIDDRLDAIETNKVDKVAGKGLSKNDYTDEEKSKLGALPTNEQLTQTLAEKPDKDSLGYPPFSTLSTYAVGDIVYYSNKLYKFKASHSAGAWNASHVDLISIKDIKADKVPTAEDGNVPAFDENGNLEDSGLSKHDIAKKTDLDTIRSGVVFDISEYHSNTTYADLATALGTNGANVPSAVRKGGMSVKFVESSDNKYVQWRYMGTSIADADFTNVANWQGVDDEPIAGSENLVKSGGTKQYIDELTGIVPYDSNIMKEILEEIIVSEDSNLYNQKIQDDGTITSATSSSVHYLSVNKGDIITINVSTSVTGQPLSVCLYNIIPSSSVTSENVLMLYKQQPFATNNTYNIIADGYFAFSCRREQLSMTIKKQVRRTTVLEKNLSDYKNTVNSNFSTVNSKISILNKSYGYFVSSSTMDIALCKNLNEVITRLEVHSNITENLCIKRFLVDTTNKLLTIYIDGVSSGNRYISIYNRSYANSNIFDFIANSGVKLTINTSLIDTTISFYSSSQIQSSSFAIINIEKCRYISTYPFKGNGLFDDYISDIKISGKNWAILNPLGENVILKNLYYVKKYDSSLDVFIIGDLNTTATVVTLNAVDSVTYKGTLTTTSSIYGTYTSEFVIIIRKKPSFTIDDVNTKYSKIDDAVYEIYYNNYLNSIAQKRAEDAANWSWKLQNYQWFWSSANCLPFMVKRADSRGQSTQTTTDNNVETFPSLCVFLNNDTHYSLYPGNYPRLEGFDGSLVREHSWLNSDQSAYEIIHSYLALGDIMTIGDWTKAQWKAQWQKYWEYIDEYAKRPQLVCLGNHDINQDYANVFEVPFDSVDDPDFSWDDIQWASKGEQRAYIIQPMLDRYKTLLGIVEDTNNAQSCYYYYDAKYQDSREGESSADKYLRMLVLDVYDFPDTWNAETKIKNYGYWNAHGTAPNKGNESFSLAQIRFIISSLESAITNGRDVCICAHDFSLRNADTIFSDYANKRQNSFTYTDLYGNSGVVSYDFTGSNGKLFFLHGHSHRWSVETKCDRYAFRLVSAEGRGAPRRYMRDTADILVYDERGLRFTRYGNCPRQLAGDTSGDLLGFHFVDTPINTAETVE